VLAKARNYSTSARKHAKSAGGWVAALVQSGVRKFFSILPVSLWLFAANAPAQQSGEIAHNLVDVKSIYPALLEEIRYATTHNFTSYTLYPYPAAYVRREVAAALQAVQEELAVEGLGLKIYDGYRPLSVQVKMWEILPDERYVSDPHKSKGKHTRGTAVDVTLIDKLGNELKMPTPYDDFTERAHRMSAIKWTPEEKANSLKLEAVMVKHGFIPFPFEWWHFDYKDWESCPPLDISFQDLAKGVKTTVPVP